MLFLAIIAIVFGIVGLSGFLYLVYLDFKGARDICKALDERYQRIIDTL